MKLNEYDKNYTYKHVWNNPFKKMAYLKINKNILETKFRILGNVHVMLPTVLI